MFRVFRKIGNGEHVLRRRGSNTPKSRNLRKHPANGIIRLQRSLGNQIVQRLVNSGNILAKPMVGSKSDPAEREADQVADRVMQTPEQDFQRQTDFEEEEEVLQHQSVSSGIKPLVQRQELVEDEQVQMQTEPEDEEQIQAQEAEEEGEETIQTKSAHNQRHSIIADVQLQQKPPKKTLDKKALSIINAAQNTKTAIDKRAIQVVKDILNVYYPAQTKLVKKVVYKESETGLRTTAATFPNAKGTITVGKYFVTHTTMKGFARRVLQVDHELEHIRQQRRGMGGPHRADLREFLAFTREALSPEVSGTGRISHSTRVALIDAALKYYYKLDKTKRSKYSQDRNRLLNARKGHASRSGRKHKPPPGPPP